MQPDDEAAYRFHMQANGLAAPTIKNDLVAHKQWRHWCDANSIDPATATKSLMMAFLADGAGRNMSGRVRLLTLGLRAYGDFLISRGVRADNPARTIKPVKQNSRPTEPLTDDDLRALLLACDTAEDRALLLLLVGGGLRRSEVLNIKAGDINPDAGTITINGKGSKYRLIAPGRTATSWSCTTPPSGDCVRHPPLSACHVPAAQCAWRRVVCRIQCGALHRPAPPTLMQEDELLTPGEVLLLIEALDAFIPLQGNNSWQGGPAWTDEQRERFGPFATVRLRLSRHIGMGFYDKGRTFLDDALRTERYDLTQALHSRMSDLLKQPGLTRRQFRVGMVAAFQELRDVRYYQVKMPE